MYLAEHLNGTNRVLHFVGTTLVYALLIAAAATGVASYVAYAPFAGYGFAWVGHFFIERNKPATFTHPLWSLVGDFRMHALMAVGRLEPHLVRARDLKHS